MIENNDVNCNVVTCDGELLSYWVAINVTYNDILAEWRKTYRKYFFE